MTCRTLPAVLALSLASASPAFAAPFIVTYTFTGSPGTQASEPVDANPVGAIFADITRGPGLTAEIGQDSINSSGWTTASTFDANDYYQWAITPQPAYELDLDATTITYERSATGPQLIQFRSSLDGFASPLFSDAPLGNDTDNHLFTILFGGFNDLTSTVTFRLYAYGADATDGTFRLGIAHGEAFDTVLPDDLQIFGDLSPTAVPEPSTLILLGTGSFALAMRRRRREVCRT